jgi:cell division protein FtsB
MQDKIKHVSSLIYSFAQRLGDIRFAGTVLFVVIVLLISWSGVKVIQTNYELQKQISALQQQNDVMKLEDENLELQKEYYKSSQYLELSARENLGLGAPGEKELIVPKQVALAHTIDLDGATPGGKKAKPQPVYIRNLEAWRDFFLHRQTATD